MDHAAGIAALHHQGSGHVPQAPSVEGRKGRRSVASDCGGSSVLCDAAERWPRGCVTVNATRGGGAVRAEEHRPLAVRDTELAGFLPRVAPSGKRTWLYDYRNA